MLDLTAILVRNSFTWLRYFTAANPGFFFLAAAEQLALFFLLV